MNEQDRKRLNGLDDHVQKLDVRTMRVEHKILGDPDDPNDNGMAGSINNIEMCLLGNPQNPKDQGLSGLVAKNTTFRQITTKISGVIGTGIVGGIIWWVRTKLTKGG